MWATTSAPKRGRRMCATRMRLCSLQPGGGLGRHVTCLGTNVHGTESVTGASAKEGFCVVRWLQRRLARRQSRATGKLSRAAVLRPESKSYSIPRRTPPVRKGNKENPPSDAPLRTRHGSSCSGQWAAASQLLLGVAG